MNLLKNFPTHRYSQSIKQPNAPEFDKYRQKYENEKHQNDLLHLKLAQATKEIEGLKSGGLFDTSQLKHLLEEVKTDSNSSQEQGINIFRIACKLC